MKKSTRTTDPESIAAGIIARHMERAGTILDIIDATSPEAYHRLLKTIEPAFDSADHQEIALADAMPTELQAKFRDLSDAWGLQRMAVVQAGYLLGVAAALRMGGVR